MITKEEYLLWRNHPVTQEFMTVVVKESDNQVADLVNTAGNNSLEDKFRRGVIVGLSALLEWVPTVETLDEEESEEYESTSSGPSSPY